MPSFVVDSLRRAKAEQNKRRLQVGTKRAELDLIVSRGDGNYWVPPSFTTGWRRSSSTQREEWPPSFAGDRCQVVDRLPAQGPAAASNRGRLP